MLTRGWSFSLVCSAVVLGACVGVVVPGETPLEADCVACSGGGGGQSGGSATGGSVAVGGGAAVGATGGVTAVGANGGESSGGASSGGTAAGGHSASGGTASGGMASGGTASGGAASGGTASGGETGAGGAYVCNAPPIDEQWWSDFTLAPCEQFDVPPKMATRLYCSSPGCHGNSYTSVGTLYGPQGVETGAYVGIKWAGGTRRLLACTEDDGIFLFGNWTEIGEVDWATADIRIRNQCGELAATKCARGPECSRCHEPGSGHAPARNLVLP